MVNFTKIYEVSLIPAFKVVTETEYVQYEYVGAKMGVILRSQSAFNYMKKAVDAILGADKAVVHASPTLNVKILTISGPLLVYVSVIV